MKTKLKIGVVGAGHLGKIHIKCIKEISEYDLVGFYDVDAENVAEVIKEHGIKNYDSMDDLIDASDVIDIVTPTLSHYSCAEKAIKKSRHVFVEKPITNTLEEAKALISLSEEAQVKVQVGHVERFNPAFTAALPYFEKPMFIETHRLAQFNPRGTDVSVVLDLMIHDIDIILSVVNSPVRKISASGVAVVSETPDITNARLEFENGCVANLTASRISMKNMRKSRFFQKNAYLAVDFLERETEIVKMESVTGTPDPFSMIIDLGEGKEKKEIIFQKPSINKNNAIKDELSSFANAVNNNLTPTVSIYDGYNALSVAYKVIDKLEIASKILN